MAGAVAIPASASASAPNAVASSTGTAAAAGQERAPRIQVAEHRSADREVRGRARDQDGRHQGGRGPRSLFGGAMTAGVLVADPATAGTALMLFPRPDGLPAAWVGPFSPGLDPDDARPLLAAVRSCSLLPEHGTGWF